MAEKRLGRFRVSERLGQGGMGTVWKAIDDATGKEVALKVVLPEHAEDPGFVKRFENEAKALAALEHENVAGCVAHGTDSGRLFLAMELLAGGSLADKLRHGPMGWREVAQVGAGIARGLIAIHERGIVHRDLKPANVLLDEDGTPKISDFGLVRDNSQKYEKLTRTGQLLGTLEYMAPEQSEGGMLVGPAADMYSLGCTLFCLLTGSPPFPGNGPEVITKHLTVVPPPVSSIAREVPPELDAVVARLLAKNPHERGDADLAARELELIVDKADRPPPRVGLAIALGAGISLVLGGLAVPFLPKKQPPPPPPPPPVRRPVPIAPVVTTTQTVAPIGTPAWFTNLGNAQPTLPPGVLPSKTVPGDYVYELNQEGRKHKLSLVLVHVPAGAFDMGREAIDNEGCNDADEELHSVRLSGYFLGKYEVSNAQFEAFVNETGYVTEAERDGRAVEKHTLAPGVGTFVSADKVTGVSWKSEKGSDLPVSVVTWADAKAFCAHLGLRLPTEAEWERAAGFDPKLGRKRVYAFGDKLPGKPCANVLDQNLIDRQKIDVTMFRGALGIFAGYRDPFPGKAPITAFADFPSPVGALNMAGNVAEWTLDTHSEKYQLLPEEDPLETRVEDPVHRGGHYMSLWRGVRVAHRNHDNVDLPSFEIGFRVALSEHADRDPRRKR